MSTGIDVETLKLRSRDVDMNQLPAGVYIVDGEKVVKK